MFFLNVNVDSVSIDVAIIFYQAIALINLHNVSRYLYIYACFQEPPNFLIAADLAIHVKPEAVMEEPEPEPEDTPVDLLVDTAAPQQNGSSSPPMPDERCS